MNCMYSVLRFVPDVARGEFANVGVVARSVPDQTTSIEIRFPNSHARAIAPAEMVRGFGKYIRDFCKYVDDPNRPPGTPLDPDDPFADLRQTDFSALQLTEAFPIVAESPKQAAELMAGVLVSDYDKSKRQKPRFTRTQALKSARQSYKHSGLVRNKDYFETIDVDSPHFYRRFDFGVANGQIVQLAQAWSFAIKNPNSLKEHILSWAFAVEELRDQGAETQIDGRLMTINKDVDVDVLYKRPDTEEGENALSEVEYACKEIGAVMIPVSEAHRLGQRAKERVG